VSSPFSYPSIPACGNYYFVTCLCIFELLADPAIFFFLDVWIFFFPVWSLNSGPYACRAGVLPLEPLCQLWLAILLSIISSRLILVIADVKIVFFLELNRIPLYKYTTVSLCICLSYFAFENHFFSIRNKYKKWHASKSRKGFYFIQSMVQFWKVFRDSISNQQDKFR
jgi:hypothetical protein